MGLYNSVQANLGPAMVGLDIPLIDQEIGVPDIPFKDVEFNNDLLAVAGVSTTVYGSYLVARYLKKNIGNATPETTKDYDLNTRKKRYMGVGRTATKVALVASVGFGMLSESDPYTTTSKQQISDIAVVIDDGGESFARNVDSEEGEITSLKASVDGLALDKNALSNLNGINVTFFGTGSDSRMGAIGGDLTGDDRTEAKEEIIRNFEESIKDPSNFGTEASGGGDIEAGLSQAAAINPDNILVVTGTLRNHEQSEVLRGEAEPDNNNVIVIALGQDGAESTPPGEDPMPAPVEPEYNELIVGENDSYTATSMNEISEVVESIIDGQIITPEEKEYDAYKKIFNKAVAFGFLVAVYEGLRMGGPKPIRATKRWINNRRNK